MIIVLVFGLGIARTILKRRAPKAAGAAEREGATTETAATRGRVGRADESAEAAASVGRASALLASGTFVSRAWAS